MASHFVATEKRNQTSVLEIWSPGMYYKMSRLGGQFLFLFAVQKKLLHLQKREANPKSA